MKNGSQKPVEFASVLACLSSLGALTTPRRDTAWDRAVRAGAVQHLAQHFNRRPVREYASGSVRSKRRPDDLIAALTALADPRSPASARAASKAKLTSYFEGLLREAAPRPIEMTSALAKLAALTERVAKMEKASAVRSKASAARTPRVTPKALRSPPAPARDFVVERIDRARRNALNNIGVTR